MKLEWENGLHLFREDLTSHACDYFHASQNIDVFMIVSALSLYVSLTKIQWQLV